MRESSSEDDSIVDEVWRREGEVLNSIDAVKKGKGICDFSFTYRAVLSPKDSSCYSRLIRAYNMRFYTVFVSEQREDLLAQALDEFDIHSAENGTGKPVHLVKMTPASCRA